MRTSEQMVFKASSLHEFIHKKPPIVLNAVSNKLNKIGVVELPKKVDFCLHFRKIRNMKTAHSSTISSSKHPNTKTDNLLTTHSLWPWRPSGFRLLTATVTPVPGLAGAVPFSSIHPLKTYPNPPSPRMLSGLKFPVADLSSWKLNWSSWGTSFFSGPGGSITTSVEAWASWGTASSLLLAFKYLVSVTAESETKC